MSRRPKSQRKRKRFNALMAKLNAIRVEPFTVLGGVTVWAVEVARKSGAPLAGNHGDKSKTVLVRAGARSRAKYWARVRVAQEIQRASALLVPAAIFGLETGDAA